MSLHSLISHLLNPTKTKSKETPQRKPTVIRHSFYFQEQVKKNFASLFLSPFFYFRFFSSKNKSILFLCSLSLSADSNPTLFTFINSFQRQTKSLPLQKKTNCQPFYFALFFLTVVLFFLKQLQPKERKPTLFLSFRGLI